MARSWYILHTYTGYESKIEKTIRLLVDSGELSSDIVLDIKVPVEEVVEIKEGKKKVSTKKFLPGYIMIELDLPDIGWKGTCSAIRRIQGVTGFVGADPNVPSLLMKQKLYCKSLVTLRVKHPLVSSRVFLWASRLRLLKVPSLPSLEQSKKLTLKKTS